ncbi:protein FAM200B-like [Limulus polyphemus]|uniref:Protein FAM200B-like n=1 Tax=Limulus polyphemus TaxID=6850 RepID=A0ABM1T013_LIMPO|nr:protein FAM200B-like [Limulus polyphemus]
MDKWLKKSVEVDDNESSVNQNEEKSGQSKRRKVVRKYDSKYLETGFTWNGDEEDPQPRCIICCDQLANESMRPNKLCHHSETKHPELKDKPLEFFERMLSKLKTGQSVMQRYTKVNEKSLYVFYLISLRIAKAVFLKAGPTDRYRSPEYKLPVHNVSRFT